MEVKEAAYNSAEAKKFIAAKFVEQGDFCMIEGLDISAMTDTAVEAELKYMEESGALDGGIYDDDEAFERIKDALSLAFPEFKMYCMRFAEDYLDYSEAYFESTGILEWE